MTQNADFTPALGRHELTGAYDRMIALMTRERRWRGELLALAAPQPGEVIVDVGCGTGTFAIMLKRACPSARVIGVDPDENVLAIARRKAAAAGVEVEFRRAFGDELAALRTPVDKVVSSLVLHQCPMAVKRAILAAGAAALGAGGRLILADYGRQRSLLMRLLFRQVQMLDGFANTEPNAQGVLPGLIEEAGFRGVEERCVVPTPTGSISIYSAEKP
ncbi:MAG: SAM-dependent methyltransferase [Caulobacter sp. 32-67-35]|nr:MAG: SAM-dependent methyltransferase [Caulobacter sp. 32-67-35]